jgi:acyl-CoA reductase-like NAD-dependent aldehyde dehydrogenase
MAPSRLVVKKTYKLYVGGQFPRSESERHHPVRAPRGGAWVANVCKGSRKDLRNAVAAARKAFDGWSRQTALNRGQVLYRVAEMLEARGEELRGELVALGAGAQAARGEVEAAIDTLVYYAGWSDKIAAVLGGVNPVSGPYHCFSVPEPMGVVGLVAPEEPALRGLVARLAPIIVSGNTAVVIASESQPLSAVTFGEVLATGDVPGGVVNVITGSKAELTPWLAAHGDVDAIDLGGVPAAARGPLELKAADSVKRIAGRAGEDEAGERSLEAIARFLEVKTVWHPAAV